MKKLAVSASCVAAMVLGCAVDPAREEVTPDVLEGSMEEAIAVTWNGNSYTLTANTPEVLDVSTTEKYLRASATITGSTTAVPAGVCLLRLTDTPCSGADPIDNVTGYQGPCAALTLPAGGWRYCTAQNGTGQKYCALRLGTQAALCGGTPAGQGLQTPPKTMTSPWVKPNNWFTYVSYACVAGCTGSDPSVSSGARVVAPAPGSDFCRKYPDLCE